MELNDLYSDFQWGELEEQLKNLHPEWKFSILDLLQAVLDGKGMDAVTNMGEQMKDMVFAEWGSYKNIFLMIVIITMLSAIFATFKDAFQNHQIADISFYINYLILIILFIGLFQDTLDIGESTLHKIEEFMKLFFPVYFITVGTVSGTATGVVYYEIACIVVYIIEVLLKTLLIPCISAYMLLVLMNGVWGEEKFEILLELWKKTIKAVLKLVLGLLTGASLIQSLITPIIDKLKGEVIYKTVEAIPGVGELAEGAMRIWLGSAVLIQNSIGVVGCLLLLIFSLVPLIKIGITGCMLKGVAMILSMVGDKRMIQCTNYVGDGVFLLFQTVAYGILFFFVVIAITAYSTSGMLG